LSGVIRSPFRSPALRLAAGPPFTASLQGIDKPGSDG
jgi:hypothetical protein